MATDDQPIHGSYKGIPLIYWDIIGNIFPGLIALGAAFVLLVDKDTALGIMKGLKDNPWWWFPITAFAYLPGLLLTSVTFRPMNWCARRQVWNIMKEEEDGNLTKLIKERLKQDEPVDKRNCLTCLTKKAWECIFRDYSMHRGVSNEWAWVEKTQVQSCGLFALGILLAFVFVAAVIVAICAKHHYVVAGKYRCLLIALTGVLDLGCFCAAFALQGRRVRGIVNVCLEWWGKAGKADESASGVSPAGGSPDSIVEQLKRNAMDLRKMADTIDKSSK